MFCCVSLASIRCTETPRTGQLPWFATVTANVLGILSLTVVTGPPVAVPGSSVLPFALTSSIEVPMAPSSHGCDVPASRTDSIQRPLPLALGLASSGERLQTDGRDRRVRDALLLQDRLRGPLEAGGVGDVGGDQLAVGVGDGPALRLGRRRVGRARERRPERRLQILQRERAVLQRLQQVALEILCLISPGGLSEAAVVSAARARGMKPATRVVTWFGVSSWL